MKNYLKMPSRTAAETSEFWTWSVEKSMEVSQIWIKANLAGSIQILKECRHYIKYIHMEAGDPSVDLRNGSLTKHELLRPPKIWVGAAQEHGGWGWSCELLEAIYETRKFWRVKSRSRKHQNKNSKRGSADQRISYLTEKNTCSLTYFCVRSNLILLWRNSPSWSKQKISKHK